MSSALPAMSELPKYLAQALFYGAFALFIGVFSSWPPYHQLQADQALIKLSIKHHGKLVAECRQRSAEELAKLAPNMRQAQDCKRERSPVAVELDVDGQPVYRHLAAASGVSKDGASSVYQRFVLSAGPHRFAVRVNDDARVAGYTHQREETLTLVAGRVLVIDFQNDGITLQ